VSVLATPRGRWTGGQSIEDTTRDPTQTLQVQGTQ